MERSPGLPAHWQSASPDSLHGDTCSLAAGPPCLPLTPLGADVMWRVHPTTACPPWAAAFN